MLILYDFKCVKCGNIEEKLVDKAVHIDQCSECGRASTRQISPVRCKLEGITGHFPDAADKWAKQHEEAGRKEPDGNEYTG